jgi:hypothetical protein
MSLAADASSSAPLLELFAGRRGHFVLESGHHGELWLDLELLFVDPERVRPFAAALARALARYDVEAVCGPLVEGAFVALRVAPRSWGFPSRTPSVTSIRMRPGSFPSRIACRLRCAARCAASASRW